MSRPTRREKVVVLAAPTLLSAALLGVAFLVRCFTHGVVSSVALWVYLAVAAWLVWWLWRRSRG